MTDQIFIIIISSISTGVISSLGTVKALNIHINYLRDAVDENKKAIARAHQRIDTLKEQN